MLENWIYLILLILAAEVLLALIFRLWAKFSLKQDSTHVSDIVKGIIERQFLFISLINGFPHSLTVFSALKLAMRLKHDDKDTSSISRYNDFFLIGNFISVLTAMGYSSYYQHIFL